LLLGGALAFITCPIAGFVAMLATGRMGAVALPLVVIGTAAGLIPLILETRVYSRMKATFATIHEGPKVLVSWCLGGLAFVLAALFSCALVIGANMGSPGRPRRRSRSTHRSKPSGSSPSNSTITVLPNSFVGVMRPLATKSVTRVSASRLFSRSVQT